ncbi:acyl carrier protein [Dysgonomonas sp. GY617]|uniref:acyl carrier protein n=1 Tax=Dysgonomonas sp. GY617 TaxID=2780420 RepID=UPI0018842DC9|nr:acyl carrier protein [Dysgonomonas sp. GY617]MBF0575883.1 acyl carrier protein [Dysgonomonas sp. GY617]
MELDQFIENFAAQFDDTDASEFKSDTAFKNLEEWSSLIALSIIAMVDEEYEAKLKGDDIKGAVTIEDLYKIVKSRI